MLPTFLFVIVSHWPVELLSERNKIYSVLEFKYMSGNCKSSDIRLQWKWQFCVINHTMMVKKFRFSGCSRRLWTVWFASWYHHKMILYSIMLIHLMLSNLHMLSCSFVSRRFLFINNFFFQQANRALWWLIFYILHLMKNVNYLCYQ